MRKAGLDQHNVAAATLVVLVDSEQDRRMEREWFGSFLQACDVAGQVIGDEAVAARWNDSSALAGFTVGGIAAHMYAGIRRFEVALDEDVVGSPTVLSLPAFYGLNRVNDVGDLDTGWHPLLRDDAERRALHGHRAVEQRFGEVVARLIGRLPGESPDRLIPVLTVANGATALNVYVATRVVELVVHSDDLAASVDLPPPQLPHEAATDVITVFIDMARHQRGDLDVIRAFARTERVARDALRVL